MAKEEFKKEMTTRFNQLVEYLKESGQAKNNTEVGKLIGQPLQVVSKLLSGERVITLEQSGELSKNSNIDANWLLTGKGEMVIEGKTIQKEPDATWVKFNNTMQVPLVLHRAQAGFLAGWGDPEYVDELPKIPWEVDQEYKGEYVCFEVSGDSMWSDDNADSLFERDILLCREVQRPHWQNKLHIHAWKYFVIVHREKGILVKQIEEHNTETGVLNLHSLNPYYEDQEVHVDDLIAIFNVVDIRRSARR